MTKPRNDRDGELEDGPDEQHRRPPGVDDITVRALGKLSEALETVERARGHLYAMHQLTGTADFQLDEAVSLFMQCGRTALAERIEQELIGRNVTPGHWTFQLVEEYDDGYYAEFRESRAGGPGAARAGPTAPFRGGTEGSPPDSRAARARGPVSGLLHRLGAAALGVVGQNDRGDEQGDHDGEEPGRVVDELGGERRLEGGQQEAHPRERAADAR